MRVVIDTSYAGRGRTGTGVYVEQLARALRARGRVELVEVRQRRRLRPGRPAGARRNPLRSAANAALDLAWERVGLPRAARRAGADVVHHPLPVRLPRRGCAQVVTFHDVAFERFPESFDPAWRSVARRVHRAAARRADALVCVSRSTADDAVELLGAPRERITVAPHGPGQELTPPGEGDEPRHFLYVGSDEPRKEVARLVSAYAGYRDGRERPLDLVLAGEAARRAGPPGVVGVDEPSPQRLGALLYQAAALVHPAPLEGFGLTLLEAMAAGTPVIALRSTSAEEVCGDAALLVSDDELATALARLHDDSSLRARLSEAGRSRAAEFSWDASAEAHEVAYRAAVERRGSRR
jgi:glycosyltransferase involved in cell wall biosynthesis